MLNRINLQGVWDFALGEDHSFADTIKLSSTTEVSLKGEATKDLSLDLEETKFLKRKRPYTGISNYRKTIQIPTEWEGKELILYLERSKYVSVYMDGQCVSKSYETLIPQRHRLSPLQSGVNYELRLEVDNNLTEYKNFPPSLINGHQYTEHTQTNWNGILGEMYLEVLEPIRIQDFMVVNSAISGEFLSHLEIENTVQEQNVVIILSYHKVNEDRTNKNIEGHFCLKKGVNRVEMKVQDEDIMYWDEFNPNLYHITASIRGNDYNIESSITTGFKNIRVNGSTVLINHIPISLRGNLDCCIYPLTGYAPMELEEWVRIVRQAKEYGLNHIRFHSWCPPKAAFEAADKEGIYLQVELSCFGNGFFTEAHENCDKVLNDYLYDQGAKIIREYGNHPSFFIFAVGNEMVGEIKAFEQLLKYLKEIRPDKLYTQGSNNFLEDPVCCKEDDIWITMRTTKTDNVRASFSHGDKPLGYLQLNKPYQTCENYEDAINLSQIPVISHEIGQYQAYPNFGEIKKYTGVTESSALRVFRDRLEKKGMLHQAEEFYINSGALLVQCYKEEIEAALRTRNMLGFQLLGLQDFPGQGTAMVGILDAFLENKRFISPKDFREFCAPQVILFKMDKGIYTETERIQGEVLIYNFGVNNICMEELKMDLYVEESLHTSKTLSQITAKRGTLTSVGNVEFEIKEIKKATKATIQLSLGGITNRYPVWIYPEDREEANTKEDNIKQDDYIFNSYSKAAEEALKAGKTIGIFSSNWEHSIEGLFSPDFWCYPMFKQACLDKKVEVAPGTLGLVIQKEHKALKEFPTDHYSSWQWKEIVNNARPIILDEELDCINIVQVIDNFDRNHKLSILFEKRMYQGKMVVCAMDLLEYLELPQVRQLYYSLKTYLREQ